MKMQTGLLRKTCLTGKNIRRIPHSEKLKPLQERRKALDIRKETHKKEREAANRLLKKDEKEREQNYIRALEEKHRQDEENEKKLKKLRQEAADTKAKLDIEQKKKPRPELYADQETIRLRKKQSDEDFKRGYELQEEQNLKKELAAKI